jgi:hypothetical protein
MNQHHSLKPGAYYHIYNRGINGENIFKEERNYAYFLSKYAIYLSPMLETYAYCLLKNHFQLFCGTGKVLYSISQLSNGLKYSVRIY